MLMMIYVFMFIKLFMKLVFYNFLKDLVVHFSRKKIYFGLF